MFPAALLQSRNIAPWDATQAQIAALPASADAQAMRFRQSLIGLALSDGATTNRRIEWTLGAAGNVAGSALSEVGHIFRVPTALAANAVLFSYASSTLAGGSGAWELSGRLLADGKFNLRINGATTADNRIFETATTFRATYSGQLVRMDFVFMPGAANPVVYLNGSDISALFAASSAGAPPDWMSASMVSTYRVTALNWPNTELRPGSPINRAISAAEVAQMVQSGALLPVDRLGGSMVSLTATNGNLETTSAGGGTAGTNDFHNWWKGAAIGVAVETVDVAPGSTKAARLTGSGLITNDTAHWFRYGAVTGGGQDPAIIRGQQFAYRFKAKYVSGAADLRVGQGYRADRTVTPAEAAVWSTFSGTMRADVSTTGYAPIVFSPATGGVWLIDDVEVWPVGALIQPEITRTAQLLDHGGNRIRGVMFAGCRPLSERDPVGIRGTSSATGFVLGLGASDSLWFEAGIITGLRIKQSVAAAQTITLRLNTSGGTVIATVVTAANTDWQLVPLVIPGGFEVSAGDRLHFTQTGAAFDWNVDWSRR